MTSFVVVEFFWFFFLILVPAHKLGKGLRERKLTLVFSCIGVVSLANTNFVQTHQHPLLIENSRLAHCFCVANETILTGMRLALPLVDFQKKSRKPRTWVRACFELAWEMIYWVNNTGGFICIGWACLGETSHRLHCWNCFENMQTNCISLGSRMNLAWVGIIPGFSRID